MRELKRLVTAIAAMLLLVLPLTPLAQNVDARAANTSLIREQLAYHVGTLAYLWGYPIVDMSKQMHNETHRTGPQQQVHAPLNHFYRYDFLVTPTTAGNLRAPNNDTLYFGGWFDLAQEPIIIHTPDTKGRYYTLAITDFFNEVTHIGQRTTGTEEKFFALVGPDFKGTLPANVVQVRMATKQVWVLGRMLVDGEADFAQAKNLMQQIWSVPLSKFSGKLPPVVPVAEVAAVINPLTSLDFFLVLNRWLRSNAAGADEAALMGLFDQIGVGPKSTLDLDQLDPATRRGLERAMTDGLAMLRASAQQPMPDVRNGWIFPLGLSDYGTDYLLRAGVVFAGYANRPEESTYVARTVDGAGQLMSGAKKYHLHLLPHEIPPAGAFWSISAYDLKTFNLIENPLKRYSLGNRTPGLKLNADGALDIYIQKDAPAEGKSNWLPVGEGAYLLVMRIYAPGKGVFDGSYKPAPLIERP